MRGGGRAGGQVGARGCMGVLTAPFFGSAFWFLAAPFAFWQRLCVFGANAFTRGRELESQKRAEELEGMRRSMEDETDFFRLANRHSKIVCCLADRCWCGHMC